MIFVIPKEGHVDKEKELQAMGIWSMAVMIVVLILVTLINGTNYIKIIVDLAYLLVGGLNEIEQNVNTSLLTMLSTIIAVVLLSLTGAMCAGMVFSNDAKSYNTDALQKILDKGPILVFLVVLAEELFTRWLFLSFLWNIFNHDTIAFYVLFIVGNSVWALYHLTNYSDPGERSPLKVIPQFIGGIAFTYVFLLYGIGAAIVAHFLYDVILFTTMKEKYPSGYTLFNIAYFVVMGIVLFFASLNRGIGLNSLTPWLNNNLIPLDAFDLVDYIVILLLVDCIIGVLANIMLLDSADINRSQLRTTSTVLGLALVALLTASIILGLNWLVSFVIADFVTRVTIVTVVVILLSSTSSGSALARAIVIGAPGIFFAVAAFTVLGFWSSVVILIAFHIAHYIPSYLQARAD